MAVKMPGLCLTASHSHVLFHFTVIKDRQGGDANTLPFAISGVGDCVVGGEYNLKTLCLSETLTLLHCEGSASRLPSLRLLSRNFS
jgi:hypothetical protein